MLLDLYKPSLSMTIWSKVRKYGLKASEFIEEIKIILDVTLDYTNLEGWRVNCNKSSTVRTQIDICGYKHEGIFSKPNSQGI